MTESATSDGAVMMGWWATHIAADTGAARASAARLRRADVGAALSEPATFALVSALVGQGNAEAAARLRKAPERLALIASTLALVRTHDPRRRLAWLMGRERPAGSGRLVVSNLRFQRLLRSADDAALAVALRRVLLLVDQPCNVAQLANDLLWWDERVRTRWCFDYFGAGEAAPHRGPEPSDDPSADQPADQPAEDTAT